MQKHHCGIQYVANVSPALDVGKDYVSIPEMMHSEVSSVSNYVVKQTTTYSVENPQQKTCL